MKNNQRVSLILLSFFAIIASCKKDDTTGTAAPNFVKTALKVYVVDDTIHSSYQSEETFIRVSYDIAEKSADSVYWDTANFTDTEKTDEEIISDGSLVTSFDDSVTIRNIAQNYIDVWSNGRIIGKFPVGLAGKIGDNIESGNKCFLKEPYTIYIKL